MLLHQLTTLLINVKNQPTTTDKLANKLLTRTILKELGSHDHSFIEGETRHC